ncbi:PAS domain-containing protein [Kiloniella sp.]|uniref:PAS domain-containing protein n=1 Tax=Kiloniella sp. TaxID=1938587 RepID=UPI003B01C804
MTIETIAEPNLDYELINMFDVGMAVVDLKLDILFINNKAIDMLGLPDAFCKKGVNFREIITWHAQVGEYGPGDKDQQILERLNYFVPGKSYKIVRKRPNGTVLQIVGNPTTSGGFAITYSDITHLEEAKDYLQSLNLELVEQVKVKNDALEQENNIRNVVMENTHHGISLFDRDLKLVICNKRFTSLLDFPENLSKPGTPIEDLFRYNAERGEYGPMPSEELLVQSVEQRVNLAKKFEAHKFRRETPSGRTLEVIGTPVEGGFVTNYTDVTDLVALQKSERETSDKLSGFLETSPVGVGISRIDDGKIWLFSALLSRKRCRPPSNLLICMVSDNFT